MFFKSKKPEKAPNTERKFEHKIGTVRISQCPDTKWRCQTYGFPYVDAFGQTVYLPSWTIYVYPPGNQAGFDTEELAEIAWKQYTDRKKSPDKYIYIP